MTPKQRIKRIKEISDWAKNKEVMTEKEMKDIISYEEYGFLYISLTNDEQVRIDKIYLKNK